jgi:HK97 family phage prohead protease
MTTIREAAQQRSAGIATPADRPSQRRCSEEKGSPAIVRAGLEQVQIRKSSDGASAAFTGFATITDAPYEMYDMFGPYTEVVASGAPAIALASDPDTNFVLNHGGVPMARTKSGTLLLSAEAVEEGDHAGKQGLKVDVPSLDLRMPTVQDVVVALERGDLDEMSFKFRITAGSWSPDYEVYTITQFDINRGDVSVVNYGANPHTMAALRAKIDPATLTADELRAAAELHAKRAGEIGSGLTLAGMDLIAGTTK